MKTIHGSSGEPKHMRQEILTTARALFIEQGYRGLSMSILARAVGVSKAALYYHFRDKEELFLAVLNELLDEIEILIDTAVGGQTTSREQIRALVHTILSWPNDQRAAIRLASQEMAQISSPARKIFHRAYQEKFIGKIQAIIEQGIQNGELRPIDPALATWSLLGMMYPYFYPAHATELPPPAEVRDRLVLIYLDGMGQRSR